MYACMHACMHACRYACVCGRQRAFCSTWPRHAHGTSARSKDLHSLHLALIYTVVHTGPTYSLRLYSFIHMAGFTSLPPDLCACLARALLPLRAAFRNPMSVSQRKRWREKRVWPLCQASTLASRSIFSFVSHETAAGNMPVRSGRSSGCASPTAAAVRDGEIAGLTLGGPHARALALRSPMPT